MYVVLFFAHDFITNVMSTQRQHSQRNANGEVATVSTKLDLLQRENR